MTDLIIYLPRGWLDSCSAIIRDMDLHKSLNHLLLALVIGVVSLGVSFIGEMSKNTQQMAASIQELNVRMGQVSDTMRDHEFRLREVEKTHKYRER